MQSIAEKETSELHQTCGSNNSITMLKGITTTDKIIWKRNERKIISQWHRYVRSTWKKHKAEVDIGLLSSNLPGTMSTM